MLVPDDGDIAVLSKLLGPAGIDVVVRLAKSPIDPDKNSVFDDFDECDFTDYAPLNTGGWSDVAVDSGGVAFSVSPGQTWTVATPTVANTVYAIYATVFIGGVHRVIACEKFPVPVTMAVLGQSITRQITYTSRRAA